MSAKFGIFKDNEGKEELSTLGDIDIGDKKNIPFFVINGGTTSIIDLKIETSINDVEINIQFPKILKPEEFVEGKFIWKPNEKTEEGKIEGKLFLFGRSIGKLKYDNKTSQNK